MEREDKEKKRTPGKENKKGKDSRTEKKGSLGKTEEEKEKRKECKYDGINNKWDHEAGADHKCLQWDQ